MRKAVIFDMDGIIFDSERATYACWMEIAKRHGFDSDLDIPYMKCVGVNIRRCEELFKEHYGDDFPFETYRVEESALYHTTYDGGRLPLKPGIHEILMYLKERDFYTAVASSTRKETVRNQLRDADLLQYFDRVVCGDEVEKSKPAPDIFLRAMEGIDAKTEETCVIEDSYNGIRAAFNAGMIPVMVPDMLPPDDEMKQKAALIAPDLFGVRDWLAAQER